MPKEVSIPNPAHREMARIFVERRDFPTLDVLDATTKFGQPYLLETKTDSVASTPFATDVATGHGYRDQPLPAGRQ